eukprot:359636-Chlamydomonas_euryale.AAC.10
MTPGPPGVCTAATALHAMRARARHHRQHKAQPHAVRVHTFQATTTAPLSPSRQSSRAARPRGCRPPPGQGRAPAGVAGDGTCQERHRCGVSGKGETKGGKRWKEGAKGGKALVGAPFIVPFNSAAGVCGRRSPIQHA